MISYWLRQGGGGGGGGGREDRWSWQQRQSVLSDAAQQPTGGPTLTYDPRRRRVPAYFLFPIIEPCFSIILSVFIDIHIVR